MAATNRPGPACRAQALGQAQQGLAGLGPRTVRLVEADADARCPAAGARVGLGDLALARLVPTRRLDPEAISSQIATLVRHSSARAGASWPRTSSMTRTSPASDRQCQPLGGASARASPSWNAEAGRRDGTALPGRGSGGRPAPGKSARMVSGRTGSSRLAR